MNLPFTPDQFLLIFEQYNRAVWPFQVFLNLLALGALVLAVKPFKSSDKFISGVLAFLWLWIGVAYHLAFFSSINPAAYVFGVANILQGFLFLIYGVFKPRLSFRYRTNAYALTGAVFVLYALVLYPAIGYFSGHAYPKAPTFGLPCPTTIFTFGLLLWSSRKIPGVVLAIPFLWSLIGFSAALTMGIYEDVGLLIAGIVGTSLLIYRDRSTAKAVE